MVKNLKLRFKFIDFLEHNSYTNTLLLYMFNSVGGVSAFLKTLDWIFQVYLENMSKNKKSEEKSIEELPSEQELALIGCGKMFANLLNTQMVLQSPFTTNMLTQQLPDLKGTYSCIINFEFLRSF